MDGFVLKSESATFKVKDKIEELQR